ncbi:MAG: radical SAM protein [Candidatus Bathyarchaeia archaeon]
MKFSFINPGPNEELSLLEKSKAIGSWPPLGILYLAAVLEKEGVETSILDQAPEGYGLEETVKWVEKENPDVLGFSTLASSGRTAALIAKEVKKRNPNILIVFGNYYATFNAERILKKYPWVDISVRGEAETTVLDMVKSLKNKANLKKVLGLTFRYGNKIVSTPDRPLIKNVDTIPFPRREMLDIEYHSILAGAVAAPKKFTSVLSSRGCVFRCRFCGCQRFARGVWRPRSVENTLEELRLIASQGYKQFLFVDDSFTLNPKRVIKLCQKMRQEKFDMEWICESRVDQCSYEIVREMVKAGCKIIYFGIESANQRILNYYNKQTTPEQTKTAVKNARKAGIDVIVGSFIVGAPDETRSEIANTLRFAETLPIDLPQFNILGVFPGMEIWEELKMKGFLKNDEEYWEQGVAVSEIYPYAVPFQEIKHMIHEYLKHYFFRPSYVAVQLLRMLKSTYRMQVIATNLTRLGDIAENVRHLG